ncbi:MAG TPA: MetQ/NlpA family ABC transporter substrate-binding protein [Selenomonadales bacterium]|nr:MetQ/NlpA family ABC transporter substrate-binding protein [Selenomonadales bacterium]
MRKPIIFLLMLALAVAAYQLSAGGAHPLRVGVVAGPQAEIMEKVKEVAAGDGLKLEIVTFDDYLKPNIALQQGAVDANSFQHSPYLESMARDSRLDLVPVAKTVFFPMGLYSKKVQAIADLPYGATAAIPSDPVNGGRALLLLERAGLIKLKTSGDLTPFLGDIADNPRGLVFRELDMTQLAGSLDAVDLAAINAGYASRAGLAPATRALLLETADSPYAGVIAVRSKDQANPAIQQLIAAYHSAAVKQFILEQFGGAVLPTW